MSLFWFSLLNMQKELPPSSNKKMAALGPKPTRCSRTGFGVSISSDVQLLHLAEALAKRWEGRQIVMLVDEISNKDMLSKLRDKSFPESVRMILVLNPRESYGNPLTLPPSYLHVTLKTPYRSTIAITSLARFIAKCKGWLVNEGDFGSDVEGTKPIFFDVGKDERKMEEALEECHKQLGDNVTILYDDDDNREPIEKWMKAAGAHWDCYDAMNFYGWEDQRVVIATGGLRLMELITRAKTKLYILLEDDVYGGYSETKGYFQQAAEEGLVEMK